jgi:hypothetical protein
MKDFARGSSAPFASGLRTVYGWHDGDSNHASALIFDNSCAEIDDISRYFRDEVITVNRRVGRR